MNDGTTATKAEPTSLYRYYDDVGVLIYVGITKRGLARQSEHVSKDWWRWVVRQEVEHFLTRCEAEAAEQALIRVYHPPFNTQHNDGHALHRSNYLHFRTAPISGSPGKVAADLKRKLPLVLAGEEMENGCRRVFYLSSIAHAAISTRMSVAAGLLTGFNANTGDGRLGHSVRLIQRGPVIEASASIVTRYSGEIPQTAYIRFTTVLKKFGAWDVTPKQFVGELR